MTTRNWQFLIDKHKEKLYQNHYFAIWKRIFEQLSYYTNKPLIYLLEYTKNSNFTSFFFNYLAWPGEGIEF